MLSLVLSSGCTQPLSIENYTPKTKPTLVADSSIDKNTKVSYLSQWNSETFLKSLPPNPLSAQEGLEKLSLTWRGSKWYNPTQVVIWPYPETKKNRVILAKLSKGPKDKAVIIGKTNLSLNASKVFYMDVYNSTDVVIPVALGLKTGPDAHYYESISQPAKHGWNHLRFDLTASNYKTSTTGWQHTSKLENTKDVSEIIILFYYSGEAEVAIDCIGDNADNN